MIKKGLILLFLIYLQIFVNSFAYTITNKKVEQFNSCEINYNNKSNNSNCLNSKKNEKIIINNISKIYMQRIKNSRATIFNALDMTDEQKKYQEEIINENTPYFEELYRNLFTEMTKLQVLELTENCAKEAFQQQKIVERIKKEIENLLKKENNKIKMSLTNEQKAKFSILKKLERDDIKKTFKTKKDYYKANPKMKHFGNPKIEEIYNCAKNSK